MSNYRVKEITDKTTWERFVKNYNPQSFLQSWNWGETHALYGETIWRLGYYNDNKLVGVCLMIGQKAKRGPHLLVPGGPLIDWDNDDLVKAVLQSMKEVASSFGAWFVRVRPELHDTEDNKALLHKYGFIKSPMHLNAENTWVLNLERSEEEILSGMRKNTRYLIRKSLMSDLTVKTQNNDKGISILYDLQNETVERNKFVGFSKKFFKSQMESFGKDKESELYIVYKDTKALAAAIIIYYGSYAYYHHSGSSNQLREIPSSYFLQWYVIREARKRKIKAYNFWGIAPEGNNNHRFSGVTTFKTGFGGSRIDWVHAHDLPISYLYWITYSYEQLRKRLRNL